MVFWGICLVLAMVVAWIVVAPLMRTPPDVGDAPDVAFYRAQMAEVERDVARDVLDAADAELARAEIGRRLLASNAKVTKVSETKAGAPIVIATGGLIIALAGGLYWQMGAPGYPDLPLQARLANSEAARENRPSQAQAEAAAPAPVLADADPAFMEAIEQLRVIVPNRPDDLQGWVLLAGYEAGLRNYPAAAEAQARVVALKGDDVTLGDLVAHVDLMVAAANGYVSPEAEVVFRKVLEADDSNIPARYYLGSLYDQTDRPDVAFRLWREIVELGDPRFFHVGLARDQIENAAFRAGVEYDLPAPRGPSAEDIANAADMSAEDQQAMVAQMVAGLADRLATQGGPATDWARLITAYGVLGEQDTAREIWVEAQQVFGTSDEALAVLNAAAANAGLTE